MKEQKEPSNKTRRRLRKAGEVALGVIVFLNLFITLIAIVSDNMVYAWIATLIAAVFEYIPFVREYMEWKEALRKGELSEEEHKEAYGKTL